MPKAAASALLRAHAYASRIICTTVVQMMQGHEQEDSSCKPPQKDSGTSPSLLHNQVRFTYAPLLLNAGTAALCTVNPTSNRQVIWSFHAGKSQHP